MGITYPAKVISQPLSKPKINEISLFSNKSFITKAVERTGAAVVTIDTQRYIKKRNFPKNSQIFIAENKFYFTYLLQLVSYIPQI